MRLSAKETIADIRGVDGVVGDNPVTETSLAGVHGARVALLVAPHAGSWESRIGSQEWPIHDKFILAQVGYKL